MEPLEILATALAYVITADGKTTVEEKAKLVALLNKHVTGGDISPDRLKNLTQAAFKIAQATPLERFLPTVIEGLSRGQQAALLLNIYDVVLVDGNVAAGEQHLVRQFEGVLGLDPAVMKQAQGIIRCKNDTAVFTDPTHPSNEPGFVFGLTGGRG